VSVSLANPPSPEATPRPPRHASLWVPVIRLAWRVVVWLAVLVYRWPVVVAGLLGFVILDQAVGGLVGGIVVVALVVVVLAAWAVPESPARPYFDRGLAWSLTHNRRVLAWRHAEDLGAALHHHDRHGQPLAVVQRFGPRGALVGLDVDCRGVSPAELEAALPSWATGLSLGHNQHLVAKPGGHQGHVHVTVVGDLPPLPEKLELLATGDFVEGLVWAQREGGEVVKWVPSLVPHILLCGATGSGKTWTGRRIVRCWMAAGGHVFIADSGKGTAFPELEGKPGVRRAIAKADIADLVEEAQAEMLRRYEVWQADRTQVFVPVLVVLEEAYYLLSSASGRDESAKVDQALTARIRDAIEKIGLLGREGSVHLLVAPQRGDASLLGGALRDNLGMRVLQLRAARDSTTDMALEMPKSAMLPGREPPVRIRDLEPIAGRVVVDDPTGTFVAQVSM